MVAGCSGGLTSRMKMNVAVISIIPNRSAGQSIVPRMSVRPHNIPSGGDIELTGFIFVEPVRLMTPRSDAKAGERVTVLRLVLKNRSMKSG